MPKARRPTLSREKPLGVRAFSTAAHRQSLAVARSAGEADDEAFVDAISEWNDATVDRTTPRTDRHQ